MKQLIWTTLWTNWLQQTYPKFLPNIRRIHILLKHTQIILQDITHDGLKKNKYLKIQENKSIQVSFLNKMEIA